MKTILLLFVTFSLIANTYSQTTHPVSANGLTFSPSTLNINTGDIVSFDVGSSHPVLEVSKSTYDSNGSDALTGGFAFSSGSGSVTLSTAGTYYYICENHISSGMKGKIVVSTTTNTSEIKKAEEFGIYPVPLNTDMLYMSLNSGNKSKSVHISVYNLAGILKLSKIESADSKIQIDCSSLTPGVYVIHAEMDNSRSVTQFIRQ